MKGEVPGLHVTTGKLELALMDRKVDRHREPASHFHRNVFIYLKLEMPT